MLHPKLRRLGFAEMTKITKAASLQSCLPWKYENVIGFKLPKACIILVLNRDRHKPAAY